MLTFIYGVMGCGKSAHIIDYYNKHENVACLKLKFEKEHYNVIHSRNGKDIPCINFDIDTDFIDLYFNTKELYTADTIIIDEVQFCTACQITDLARIARSKNVMCYGLLRNNDGNLFHSTALLLKYSDKELCLERECVLCHENNATVSRRYVPVPSYFNQLQHIPKTAFIQDRYTQQSPMLISSTVFYLSICNACAHNNRYFTKKELKDILEKEYNENNM